MNTVLSMHQLDLALAQRVYLYSHEGDGWLFHGPGLLAHLDNYLKMGYLVLDTPLQNCAKKV